MSQGAIINDPETLAEVTVAFRAHEAALHSGDRQRLDEVIWASDHAVFYELDENLHGHDAIARFQDQRTGGVSRVLINTVITTFGQDLATASTEFVQLGASQMGRQSQTWARTADGWRIVAAHVSLMAADR